MCVNNLPKVALDSEAVVIEPAISNRKSNTTNDYATELHFKSYIIIKLLCNITTRN